MVKLLVPFSLSVALEDVHPLQLSAEDEAGLEMFTPTEAAKLAVEHRNKVLNLTPGTV